MTLLQNTDLERQVTGILLDYAEFPAGNGFEMAKLSLRNDLSIESLSLVSVVLRLGDELGVDVVNAGLDLRKLQTVGDLVNLAQQLKLSNRSIQ